MHRGLGAGFGAAAGGLARPLYRPERGHTRSVEGGRLPLRHGLGDGRPADLDAHPRRARSCRCPIRSKSTTCRRWCFAATPAGNSPRWSSTSSTKCCSSHRNTRWCLRSRRILLSSASHSGCTRFATRFAISCNTATNCGSPRPARSRAIARVCPRARSPAPNMVSRPQPLLLGAAPCGPKRRRWRSPRYRRSRYRGHRDRL